MSAISNISTAHLEFVYFFLYLIFHSFLNISVFVQKLLFHCVYLVSVLCPYFTSTPNEYS